MPFPGGTYLPSFRNGVLMMSSDLRDSYLVEPECLFTAGVVLAYAGGCADRAASLPSLPSDQSSIAYAGRPARQRLSCYSTVHYAGRVV